MTKFSSSSRHNRARFFFYLVLTVVVVVSVANLFGTLMLQKFFRRAARHFLSAQETSLTADSVYFNVLKGATISGLEMRKDHDVLFSARRVDIGFDGASIFGKKIRVKAIKLVRPFVAVGRLPDAVRVLREEAGVVCAFDNAPAGFPATLYDTVFFQAKDIIFEDVLTLDMSGYLNCVKGDLWVSRGTILVKKILFPALPDMDFFEGSYFYKPFDFTLETSLSDGKLTMSHLELSNPHLRFTGSGDVITSAQTPSVNVQIDFPGILLEDFPVLNQSQVRSRGVLDGTFKVTGPTDKVRSTLSLRLSQGEFSFYNAIVLSRVKGVAQMTPEHLAGEDFSLSINDMPLHANFEIYARHRPHLVLRLVSDFKVSEEPALDASLSADWRQEGLLGDAQGAFRYQSGQTFNKFTCRFRDFQVGYDESLFLSAKFVEGGFMAENASGKERKKILSRELTLQDLFGVFKTAEEGFVVDHIKAACYDGTLEGRVQLLPEINGLGVKGEAHLKDVNLSRLAQESVEPLSLTHGILDGDLRFDNALEDQLKGQIFIVNGEIEKNPILVGVADFLGVASLKKLSFGDLSTFFNGGRGNYSVQVKLTSSLVNGSLEGKVTSYDKMDGYLSVSIATQALNESKYFKKLLIYLKHDEPSVVFPFKISSYLNSPRILWLKNEFKEKLQHLLPESNKRVLQGQINTMVEKIQEE